LSIDTNVSGEVSNGVSRSQVDIVFDEESSFDVTGVGGEVIEGNGVEVLDKDGDLVDKVDFWQLLAGGGSASAGGRNEHVADSYRLAARNGVGLEGVGGAGTRGSSARFGDVAFASGRSANSSGGLKGTVAVATVSTVTLFGVFDDTVSTDGGRGAIGAFAAAFKVDVDISFGNLGASGEKGFEVGSDPGGIVNVRGVDGNPRSTTELDVLHGGTETNFKVHVHEEGKRHEQSLQSTSSNQPRGLGEVEGVKVPRVLVEVGGRIASSRQFVLGECVEVSSSHKESNFEGSILKAVAFGLHNSRELSSIVDAVVVVIKFVENATRNTIARNKVPIGASIGESMVQRIGEPKNMSTRRSTRVTSLGGLNDFCVAG